MYHLLFTLLLCWLAVPVLAQQQLARARQRSYLTRIFRLTDPQAGRLFARGLRAARPDFFQVPVDSFPTDSAEVDWVRRRPLPPGYYLVAHTEGPELVYWLRAETGRTVEVLDNQRDLVLVVRDSTGQLVPDARVRLRHRAVPFDPATRTYRLADAGRPGLVAVAWVGRTTYQPLDRPDAYRYASRDPWAARAGRRVLYGFPLGYLSGPVRSTVRDLAHASAATEGVVGLLRSAFSEDVREKRQEHRKNNRYQNYSRRWRSYLVLSQPRYRPGDTLRLKARVLRWGSGRPRRRPLTLLLRGGDYGNGSEKRLVRLTPTRPGTYEYSLVLTDSLGIRPDTEPRLLLRDAHGKAVSSRTFGYEDYELKNSSYTLRLLEPEPRRGRAQAALLRGTDANGLALLDARVQLLVLPEGEPGPLPTRRLFVPDTLWRHAQLLDPLGETRIDLPAGIVPDVDLRYRVQATLLTTDNELRTETRTATYSRDPGQLRLTLHADTLRLGYDSLGAARPHRAWLRPLPTARQPEPGPERLVHLPLALPVDALLPGYQLRDAAGRTASLRLTADNAGLRGQAIRTADSVQLLVDNPRHLPFWYFVYRGEQLRYRGYGTRYALTERDASATPWHLSLHYRWGDDVQAAECLAAPPARQLVISTSQPAAAYPGQRVQLTFRATTEAGEPVAGADLAAFAYTSKFGAGTVPALPVVRRQPPVGRRSVRRFGLGGSPVNSPTTTGRQALDWARWRRQLGLDSLEFYRFLYPAGGQYRNYQPAPGGLTQVAPFVVERGQVQAPLAFYIDGQPAWLGVLAENQPYTAVATPGPHTLSLRLPDRLLTLPAVQLQAGQKLTVSVDPTVASPGLQVARRPTRLSATEDLALRRTVLAVEGEAGPIALHQGPTLRLLSSYRYYGGYRGGYGGGYRGGLRLAGPFHPDSIHLRRLADGTGQGFVFQPLYAYSFPAGTVQLRGVEDASLGSFSTSNLSLDRVPISDFAFTPDLLLTARPPAPRRPTLPLGVDGPGRGRLEVRVPAATRYLAPRPLYILLTQPAEPAFRRVGWGGEVLRGLAPGRYQVAVLLDDTTALAAPEPVLVEADGTTYLQLDSTDRRPAIELLPRLYRALRELGGVPAGPAGTPPSGPPPTVRRPGWLTVRGRVTDRASGEGLPGVTVLVKGTAIGTSTSSDGDYLLQVPPEGTTLSYQFIGYTTVERLVSGGISNVALAPDAKALGEVVVVGYGASRNFVGGLSGRAAGVQVQTPGPGGLRVMLRGSRSLTSDAATLVIINGMPSTSEVLGRLSPDDIAETRVLKGEQATALYGSQAAGGVLVVTTRAGARPIGLPAELLPGADPRLNLRRHFRDYAWWRPTLLTDAQGRARTEVLLPDDVTGWDTFVVGSDDHGRLGGTAGRLRSFKALRAELAAPRFLVAGDRTQVLGKVLNYQGDTAQITAGFRQGGRVLRERTARVASSLLDTLTLTAPPRPDPTAAPDSLEITYSLTQANGFADGEQHRLPVLPAGSTEAVGTFAALLAADTTVAFRLDPRLGPATLHVERDALPTLLAEINHLEQYAYLCNEQLASRLLGLLLERQIRQAQGEPFRRERSIRFLMRRLQSGRHRSGLWGTWPTSEVSPWATLHVVEALEAAAQAGFGVDYGREQVVRYLLAELDDVLRDPAAARPGAHPAGWVPPPPSRFGSPDDQLRLLALLRTLDVPADYPTYLRRLEQHLAAGQSRPALDHYLALTELRQRLGLPYQLDSLARYRHRSVLGGAYYADTLHAGTYYRYLLPDRVGTTLLAYRVLRRQGGHLPELARLRAWLLEQRGGGYWPSTYQAAQLLATIGPDLLAAGSPTATGTVTGTVTLSGQPGLPAGPQQQFPLTLKLPTPTAAPLLLHKTGSLPVYATATQTRWLPNPEAAARPFTVTTTLAGQRARQVALPAGRPAELLVTVDAPAEARYVLLEVPVPAGCSYGDPARPNAVEVHREYLRQQTGIFIDYLPAGRHTFRISVQPRFRGVYTLNPARAELLYFPTKMGRTAGKRVVIN